MDDVTITVDAGKSRGPLRRIWRSIGYDEINWTYTPIGREICRQLGALSDGPYWVRNHNAFTSGNQRSESAWGSTNCYTEDENGQPHYDWGTIDRVYDTFVESGLKPMIELAFMPHDLSSHPEVGPRESWRYPPKEWARWDQLNACFARHLLDRYGLAEVRTWYFSTWNEADINYFRWKPDEDLGDPAQRSARDEAFFELHDHTCAAIWAVDESLRIGGPDAAYNPAFLDRFLAHCHDGVNYVTGERGTRLDFISGHVKGTRMDADHRVANPDFDLVARRRWLQYAAAIGKYERFTALPLIGNEWDIDVGTTLGTYDSPDWEFRNTAYYPVFVIRAVKEMLDLMERDGLEIELVMQWAFYFHGMRCFEGMRALFDPYGIRKPLFNGFELLSRLGETRIEATTDDREDDVAPGETVGMGRHRPASEAESAGIDELDRVQPHPRVDALATSTTDAVQVSVWHQVADQRATGERRVQLLIEGLAGWRQTRVTHYRIDDDHSNAHSVWRDLGRPDYPSDAQLAAIRERQWLEQCAPRSVAAIEGGRLRLKASLPMHAVSLFLLERL